MTSRAVTIEKGSRIAVTGATGYIGTRLVPRLARAGYRRALPGQIAAQARRP